MHDSIETLFSEIVSTLRKLTNSINRKNKSEFDRVEKFLKTILFKINQQLSGAKDPEMHLFIEKEMKSIKGELLRDLSDSEIKQYIFWMHKLLRDTVAHNKDIKLLKEFRYYKNTGDVRAVEKIKRKRKNLEPKKYPKKISIGDIVYLQCGFGYCGEINTNHYAIIMSEIQNQMYFVIPLSSDELRIFPYYLDNLKLPNADHDEAKLSYLRFDQARFVHYRRIENIMVNDKILKRNISHDKIIEVNNKFLEFMNFQLTSDGDDV